MERQDSGVLGHGDRIRTPSVKNFIDDSLNGSISVVSDIAIGKVNISALKLEKGCSHAM